MSIQQMRERRNALALKTRKLLDDNDAAAWNNDLDAQYNAALGEIEAIDAAIAREEKALDLMAERELDDVSNAGAGAGAQSKAREIHQKWLRGGDRALSNEDWGAIRNTMSTTADTEGGYAVPTAVAAEFLEAMKAYGGMRAVADVQQTPDGAPMSWPTTDGTAEEGEIVAENISATDEDISFGTKNLPVYKFSSKVVTVPIELLQDAAANVEDLVNRRLRERLGRITNRLYTVGTGTAQPNGVITAATVGRTGTTGQTGTVIYDDLVALEHSVDPAYRDNPGVRWMMHDDSLRIIRLLKDADGRPIFVPSYDRSIRDGAPAELLGRPIQINQHMATMAANARSIAFGDLGKYVIRDAMQITLFRFTDSAYAKKGQVGFLAWMRSGGNLMDVGGAVKVYANSAT